MSKYLSRFNFQYIVKEFQNILSPSMMPIPSRKTNKKVKCYQLRNGFFIQFHFVKIEPECSCTTMEYGMEKGERCFQEK